MREFSQHEVNKIVAKANREFDAEIAAKRAELQAARRADAVEVLKSHNIDIRDDESVDAALERHRNDVHAKIDNDHQTRLADVAKTQAAEIDAIRADTTAARGELTSGLIERDLRKAATALDAYDPDQVVTFLRPFAKRLGNETVIRDYAPSVLQSPGEAVALMHDSPTSANLFRDFRPAQ